MTDAGDSDGGADDSADAPDPPDGGDAAGREDADAPDGDAGVTDAEFEADRAAAAEMLAGEDVDGFFAGVVRGGELDYAFGHRVDEPETVGTQALALAAKHLQAIADNADVTVEQVAADAAQFASAFEGDE